MLIGSSLSAMKRGWFQGGRMSKVGRKKENRFPVSTAASSTHVRCSRLPPFLFLIWGEMLTVVVTQKGSIVAEEHFDSRLTWLTRLFLHLNHT